ncbi:hypothetical protein CPB86DRAFT_758672 [Serendipita vermifera]|nr:hypothetical protein CPB86DRAFT_758672 [Serendipita vermifera]
MNPGDALHNRFEPLRDVVDINKAILLSLERPAIDLTPDGHSNKLARLSGLGSSLETGFRQLISLKLRRPYHNNRWQPTLHWMVTQTCVYIYTRFKYLFFPASRYLGVLLTIQK